MNATSLSRALCLTLTVGGLAACGGDMGPTVDPIVGSWQDTDKKTVLITLGADGSGGMAISIGASSDASLAGCSSIASAGFLWKAAPYRVTVANDTKLQVLRTGCQDASKNVSPAAPLPMDDPDAIGVGIAGAAVLGAFTTDKTTISVSGDKMTVTYDFSGTPGSIVFARKAP